MATYNSGVIQIPIQPTPVELARMNVPLLGAIPKWRTPDEQLKWNANFGGAGATGEAVTASVSAFTADIVDQATLPIGTYRLRSSFQVLETKYTQAIARGTDALANLLEYSSMGARREIIKTLGVKLITGAGGSGDGGVIGLNTIVSTVTANAGTPGKQTSTNAYAGHDPDTSGYELWTNLVYDSFGTLTKKKLNEFEADMLQGTTTGVPTSYNAVAMSPVTSIKYAEVFDTSAQMTVNPVSGADLGTGNLTYNGRPIVADPSITDGEMHFVDLDQLRLYSFDQASAPEMSDEEPMEGLLLYSKILPSDNPQMLKFALFGMFQLQLRERTALSVIKGVTV